MASILERETEFCSGTEEDDLEAEEEDIHSPTDTSEDSVDVKVGAITIKNKNKRKCSEPKKVDMDFPAKRRKLDISISQNFDASTGSPFRPWSASPVYYNKINSSPTCENRVNLTLKIDVSGRKITECFKSLDSNNYLSKNSFISSQILNSFDNLCGATESIQQNVPPILHTFHYQEPLALVSKNKEVAEQKLNISSTCFTKTLNNKDEVKEVPPKLTSTWNLPLKNLVPSKIKFFEKMNKNENYRMNKMKFASISKTTFGKNLKSEVKAKTDVLSEIDSKFKIGKLYFSESSEKCSNAPSTKSSQGSQQKNYKNMTRERRIEANARERTRVHTISAAFDTLRRSIPAYSHNQKLSKLSVLRIACSYIITLSRLAGYDYSKDQSKPDLSNCVEKVSKTIQTEGKIRKKRED